MELIVLTLMVLSLFMVFTVDVVQKRRRFLQESQ